MRLRAGTSGFGYREWKGKFYPRGLPASRMLEYYAERFGAVEINSSFYRMPSAAAVLSWARQAPPGFSFSFKAPRSITHLRRLSDAAAPLERFLAVIAAAGPALGCAVFQLPPSFKKDLPRLERFLALLPPEGRFAFEFRHPSWFSLDALEALRARGAALAYNDADVRGCPLAATAAFGVLKLRRTRYSARELSALLRRVRALPWAEVFVFFKHEARATGPRLAARLLAIASPSPGRAGAPRGARSPGRRAAAGRRRRRPTARPARPAPAPRGTAAPASGPAAAGR